METETEDLLDFESNTICEPDKPSKGLCLTPTTIPIKRTERSPQSADKIRGRMSSTKSVGPCAEADQRCRPLLDRRSHFIILQLATRYSSLIRFRCVAARRR